MSYYSIIEATVNVEVAFNLKKYTIRTARYGRKTKTIVYGLDDDLDLKYIAKCIRRELKCSAAYKKDKQNDIDTLILQGDMSSEISDWLVKNQIARKDELVYRGV